MQEHKNNNNPNLSENPNPPPPPPPPHNRRPRVREVSSRFMTPKVSSVNRRRDDSSDDENSESSFPITSSFIPHKKQQNQRAIKLFKETTNEVFESNPHPSKSCSSTPRASRPDTPIPTVSVSSRYRFTPHHQNHQYNHHRSIDAPPSAAKKLLQFSGAPKTNDDSGISCSTQSLPELCCENDRETNVSIGSVAEKIGNSLLSRSVSLSSSVAKQCGSGSGNLHLPPVAPQFAKSGVGTRRGKKVSSHQEDVHSLRLLYNRYMQWRFCNARAAFAMKAQQKECEKALYSVATKISEMRESTIRKRIELELLRRSKTLSTVLEAQIPYLDEWSAMEEDYSVSITEAIQALLNASAQLPTVGNVRVDVRELGESLNTALKMMETIVSNTQRLMPKAEETDNSISELARVVGGERALIGECGDLLSKTYKSQVEECSLRGQQIQLHLICHKNKKNKE